MQSLNHLLLFWRNPWRLAGWLLLLSVLVFPFIAMQFSTEVHWTGFDFMMAAMLLTVTAFCIELAVRSGRSSASRAGWVVVVLTSLLLTWVNLAVGVIGSEQNPANLLYLLVLVVVVMGAVWARFQARAMSRILWLAAALHMTIELLIQLTGSGAALVLNSAFALLWLLAAVLLRCTPELSSGSDPEA